MCQVLGVERLTWLGRVTSARVLVSSLTVDSGEMESLLKHWNKKETTAALPDCPVVPSVSRCVCVAFLPQACLEQCYTTLLSSAVIYMYIRIYHRVLPRPV